MKKKFREPINSLTHLLGAALSIIAFAFLLSKSLSNQSWPQVLTVTIFSIGTFGLYLTSSLYHGLNKSKETLEKWRTADHIMIYILIAATYTPICILTLKGSIGMSLLIVIWILTALGIAAKFIWINMPRGLYTALYALLGWVAVFAIGPLYKAIGLGGLSLLMGGGVSYTVGALIYGLKFKQYIWKFGFHELFHIFILMGTILHFTMIYNYMLI